MSMSRRDFSKMALLSVPLASVDWSKALAQVGDFSSKFDDVQIGVQTYSYRSLKDRSAPWSAGAMDDLNHRVAAAAADDGINIAEYWVGLVEPPGSLLWWFDQPDPPGGVGMRPWLPGDIAQRIKLRDWRRSRQLGIFENARKTFDAAGVKIYSSMANFDDLCTEDEFEYFFDVAEALGTRIVTANSTTHSIRRAAPIALKRQMIVACHSEDAPFDPSVDGMVFGDNLLAATELNPNMRITLDIGHFWAYGGDPVEFVRKHHDKLVNLHLKDRLKDHPEFHTAENDVRWAAAPKHTPIKQVLQLMKSLRVPFPACIEYEFQSDKPAVQEVKWCLDYAKTALG